MTIAVVLGAWGAVVSSGLALIRVLEWRREHASLRVDVSLSQSPREDFQPEVLVDVRNVGNRATSITCVAVDYIDADQVDGSGICGREIVRSESADPVRVDGNSLLRFRHPISESLRDHLEGQPGNTLVAYALEVGKPQRAAAISALLPESHLVWRLGR